jgi:Flp pilus assembly protein TadG
MRRERGSVTAEAAMVLPAMLLVTLALATAIVALNLMLRCQDAAREAARAAARSESADRVHEIGRRSAPAGSSVAVDTAGAQIVVTVTAHVPVLGGLLPAVTVTGRAVAEAEPSG